MTRINSPGYTLMELVVATGLFAIFSLISFRIFLSSIRVQRQLAVQTIIQQEAQFALESIVKQIRASEVYYPYYGSGTGYPAPSSDLALLTLDQRCLVFSLKSSKTLWLAEAAANPDGTCPNPGNWQEVTATNVLVEDLKFYIRPATDPFVSSSTTLEQPRVTIVMKLLSQKQNSQQAYQLQATIPQRLILKK